MTAKSNKKLIVLSGDVRTRRQVSDLAAQWFAVLATPDAQQALTLVASQPAIAVVVVDHAAGEISGVNVLERVRTIRSGVRRVLLAEAEDFASLIVGLHSGAIEHLIHKPVSANALWQGIQPAIQTNPKKSYA